MKAEYLLKWKNKIKQKEQKLKLYEEELRATNETLEEDIDNLERDIEKFESSKCELERKEEKVDKMFLEAERELKSVNNFHPYLDKDFAISSNVSPFQIRILAPSIEWDDRKKQGTVRLQCHNTKTNKSETVCYAITEKTFFDMEINEHIRNEISSNITDEMFKILRGRLCDTRK